jgi:integrase
MTFGGWVQHWIDTYAPIRCTSGVTIERYQRLANYLLRGTSPELSELSVTPLTGLNHIRLAVTAVAARLGHADANITLRTYGHAIPLDDVRVADVWDKVIADADVRSV